MKKMTITGHVGKDPEVRADQAGNKFVNFSVGVKVGTKANPKTDWVHVTCNGKLGEIAIEHIKQGAFLLIEGFPGVNGYISKDKVAVGVQKLSANNIEFLSKKEIDDIPAEDEQITDHSPHILPEANLNDAIPFN